MCAELHFARVMSESQIRQTARLASDIWREHYIPIVGRPQIEYMLEKFQGAAAISEQIENEGLEYYLIEADGNLVGYFAILPEREKRRTMLSKIYVGREQRRRGIGGKVLDFVDDQCRQRGMNRVWLTVYRGNSNSIEWYRHRGFRFDGPYIQDIGGGFVMNDFKMVKAVADGGIVDEDED